MSVASAVQIPSTEVFGTEIFQKEETRLVCLTTESTRNTICFLSPFTFSENCPHQKQQCISQYQKFALTFHSTFPKWESSLSPTSFPTALGSPSPQMGSKGQGPHPPHVGLAHARAMGTVCNNDQGQKPSLMTRKQINQPAIIFPNEFLNLVFHFQRLYWPQNREADVFFILSYEGT